MTPDISYFELSEEDISNRLLKNYGLPIVEDYPSALLSDAPMPAAVLVPLLKKYSQDQHENSWHLLLTRRSDSLIEHRGQVAFPGGRSNKDDPSPEATALREAHEEIGIRAEDVHILGRLESMLTISNYSVTPIVGVIPWPYEFELAIDEVSRVFTIPISWLANPINHKIQEREVPRIFSSLLRNRKYPVIYYNSYDGELLWGVSAEITKRLVNTLIE
jgi:8-oxo-dGTP pyrophosphatase MutT (NUDIX family)